MIIALAVAVAGYMSGQTAGAAPTDEVALKGIVLWPHQARNRPDLSAAISLEFAYALPSDVVSGTNATGALVCDWSRFDALLDDIASRGHQAIIRFRYAYPGEKTGGVRGVTAVPAFVKGTPGYKETFAANPEGDGPTYYPDWSCPALEDFTLSFYKAFAARYDADPRLAFVQTGFGHWAEYHTSGTKTQLGKNFPTIDFQRRFLALLAKSFVETPWMISIDAADDERSPAACLASEGMSFGLFDDSFMCKKHDVVNGKGGWNERNWKSFGADHWKRAPHGGEISYYSSRDQREFLNPKGLYGTTWAQAAVKYHMTFVIAGWSVRDAGTFSRGRARVRSGTRRDRREAGEGRRRRDGREPGRRPAVPRYRADGRRQIRRGLAQGPPARREPRSLRKGSTSGRRASARLEEAARADSVAGATGADLVATVNYHSSGRL